MKSKILRLICLMLVLVFAMSALVACGSDDDGDDDGPKEVTGTGEDRFKDVSFDGKTITLMMSRNQSPERSGVSTAKYMNGLEDATNEKNENDQILMPVYNRNKYVEEKLQLNVEYIYTTDDTGTLATTIKTKYDAHDGGCGDAVANMTAGVTRVMMMGILSNVNRRDVTNYFDFTDASWYRDVLLAYSLGTDTTDITKQKMYILGGDYFIDIVRTLDILFVNETVLESTNGSGKAGVSYFYEMIKGGPDAEGDAWTYDRMWTYADLAHEDNGSYGGQHDKNDKNGIVFSGSYSGGVDYGINGVPTRLSNMAIVYSADIDYLVNNGNGYQFNTVQNLSALTTLRDKVLSLCDCGYAAGSADGVKSVFAANTSLFALGLKLYNLESTDLQNLKICPIPLPKLSETDEYKAYMHNNASVGAVFKTGNFEAVSAYWQYCNIMSTPVRETYYTKGLGLKYDASEDGKNTKAMLDIIYNAIDVNISFVWENIAKNENAEAIEFTEMFQEMVNDGSDIAGLWATYGQVKTSALNTVMQNYEALN